LAYELGILNNIIEKPPSAGMWPDQKDEDEFGFSYEQADPILYSFVDLGHTPEELKKMGCDNFLVDKIVKRVVDNEFKRKPQIKPTLPKEIFNSDA
jgi:NAD+ synthase